MGVQVNFKNPKTAHLRISKRGKKRLSLGGGGTFPINGRCNEKVLDGMEDQSDFTRSGREEHTKVETTRRRDRRRKTEATTNVIEETSPRGKG